MKARAPRETPEQKAFFHASIAAQKQFLSLLDELKTAKKELKIIEDHRKVRIDNYYQLHRIDFVYSESFYFHKPELKTIKNDISNIFFKAYRAITWADRKLNDLSTILIINYAEVLKEINQMKKEFETYLSKVIAGAQNVDSFPPKEVEVVQRDFTFPDFSKQPTTVPKPTSPQA